MTSCLLKNEPATYRYWQVKTVYVGATAKASVNERVLSIFIDPNLDDLTMARMKLR